jgi:outer membrane cobalamin receptor
MSPSRIFVRFLLFSLLLVSSLGFATDLKVKVTDPQKAVVAGARVALYPASGSTPIAVQRTSTEGIATFANIAPDKSYSVEVAVPGFALASVKVEPASASVETNGESTTVELKIAGPSQTVTVSATRTPLPAEESAADVTQIPVAELTAAQPASAADIMRFQPGAVIGTAGQQGGLASLFVRGGESRYNKVIIDGVTVNDPGGTFNFGTRTMDQIDRAEFVRGAESALYGSDAMTSVVQMWTRNGTTRVPELRFGADGGNFGTANGYASLAGARGRFDYNLFGDQFNTNGQGPNDAYSNSSEGANVGVQITPQSFFRFNARHANSRTGVPSSWDFNGTPVFSPDSDQFARDNAFQASGELAFNVSSRWQNRITVFEYNRRTLNRDSVDEPLRETPIPPFVSSYSGFIDSPFDSFSHINQAGVDYQGEYDERSWARTIFGYRFQDENGWVGDMVYGSNTHGLRRNQEAFGQQVFTWKRLSLIAAGRFVHNESFGNTGLPRVAGSVQVLRGGNFFSGTRLRAAYSEGFKEPRLEEAFAKSLFVTPNPGLKPERNQSLEAGFQQNLVGGKYEFSATYFHNSFTDLIAFSMDPTTFMGQYVNLNRSLAHGAELVFSARPVSKLLVKAAYSYTSTQILNNPFTFDPLEVAGRPLLRRPRNSGTLSATWSGRRWGANVGATAVGRRSDSDFDGLTPAFTYAAGYARVDLGFWRAITPRMTAYVNIGNAFNNHYNEVVGYPALGANFRAGMRFRIGGE